MKPIETPSEDALQMSIRNNIFFYYVALFTWVGFVLYALAYKDMWLMLDSIIFMIGTAFFGIGQKIDKARLEIMRKK